MIEGRCHCGAVRFTLADEPEWLTLCNCSLCRRLGALWGHVEIGSVEIERKAPTRAYVQGDRLIACHSCSVCGCTTHWEELYPEQSSRMGVNFRLCAESTVAAFRVRRRDGAETGEYLD